MNKLIATDERIFMSLVGPSGCGKSQLILDMLNMDVFQPKFNSIIFFYQFPQEKYFQSLIKCCTTKHIKLELVQGADFEVVDDLPNDGTNYLLVFDDSCEEISRSKSFEKIATAGRHKKLNVIYIKHNLFHKSPLGRDIELQNTHIVLFKSPRDVNQVRVLGRQLGLGRDLENWYKRATKEPYGHLLIDLSPKTVDHLRFSSGFSPSKFYIPNRSSRSVIIDDQRTQLLYAQSVEEFLTSTSGTSSHPWSV